MTAPTGGRYHVAVFAEGHPAVQRQLDVGVAPPPLEIVLRAVPC